MIRFALVCEHDHDFESWFANGDEFERLAGAKLLSCPACGSASVSKALMTPRLATGAVARMVQPSTIEPVKQSGGGTKVANVPDERSLALVEVMGEMQKMARAVRAQAEDVGEKFPEEARKIHYGEAKPRGIYGKASRQDVAELHEEGVGIMPLPDLPEDAN
jgi:hypothetical protein